MGNLRFANVSTSAAIRPTLTDYRRRRNGNAHCYTYLLDASRPFQSTIVRRALFGLDNAPILIVHGDKDALVPVQQAEIMAAKLKEAGVDSLFILKKGGQHDGALVREHVPNMIAWFDRHLGKK